jgi:hypothetical protein
MGTAFRWFKTRRITNNSTWIKEHLLSCLLDLVFWKLYYSSRISLVVVVHAFGRFIYVVTLQEASLLKLLGRKELQRSEYNENNAKKARELHVYNISTNFLHALSLGCKRCQGQILFMVRFQFLTHL